MPLAPEERDEPPSEPEREFVPPAPPLVPRVPTKAWLAPVFAALSARDPDTAGRLFVDLLPAQQLVHPGPIAYDLVFGKRGSCVRVTSVDGPAGSRVELADEPRPAGDVSFQVTGDYGQLAQLVVDGRVRWWRRRSSHAWGLARVRWARCAG